MIIRRQVEMNRFVNIPSKTRVLTLALLVCALLVAFSGSAARAQLVAPTLISPANGTTTTVANYPPLAVPEFRWQAVKDARLYKIQFSQDVGFASVRLDVNTPNTSYTPPDAGIFSDGTWYWRVRVEDPGPPGNYSTAWSFTKQWASPENAPVLNAPADGAALAFYDDPVFSWQPVMGAASYRFQIASSPDGFNNPVYNNETLAPTHQPAEKRANGTYYWRVVPVDPHNRDGTPSAVRRFEMNYDQVPTMLEPANYSYPSLTPAFRWTAARGAQFYRLEYSTDPAFPPSNVNGFDTRNTAYTPLVALPNDVNTYWRVRAQSGLSISPWSPTWTFLKRWYTQTVLLTPINGYQFVEHPVFSWTPVPGAAQYKIEVSPENSFPPTGLGFMYDNVANTSFVKVEPQSWFDGHDDVWYWRVTPRDANGNYGRPSAVSSFVFTITARAPQLIYPPYYYRPDHPDRAILQPREDRTVSLPVFMWHRLVSDVLSTSGQMAAYRVQVDDNFFFASPEWTFDTENLSAVPTADHPFTPISTTLYYWRVRPLTGLGGAEIGQWSQQWATRIDLSRGLPPRNTITLLRPAHGAEFVETNPLLEWWPLQGADSYQVQISTDANFDSMYIIHTATVPYPAYTPQQRPGLGTYYWRVRGLSGGSPVGDWSAPWRFHVVAQSRWRENRTLGGASNRSLIGSDPQGDMTDPNYDLTTLYAVQDKDDWFFGFHVYTGTGANMTYVLYLDLDRRDGSGAISDAMGYNVNTVIGHRPEYALYVSQQSGSFSASDTYIYRWDGSAWSPVSTLGAAGGALYYMPSGHYLELRVPATLIGMEEETGSASLMLFSAMAGGGHAQDTVPSDPAVAYTVPESGPATTTLSRFTGVSDRLNLAAPFSNITGDPTVFPSLPLLFWHKPVDAPWLGYQIQFALDEQFTKIINDTTIYDIPYRLPTHWHHEDLEGDNTYYWRARAVHKSAPLLKGAWSEPYRFERLGFVPQNLRISVAFATPTFSWSMVEGARFYHIEVDNDPGFGSPEIRATTAQNSFTPLLTLERGTYYWRVRVERYDGVFSNWASAQPFTLELPRPAGLRHSPSGVVSRAPTLCWTPVVTPTGSPVLAAWKYRVQVSPGDPTFSSIYDDIVTEQSCWTPTRGYDDRTNYYWRVAMIDGDTRIGGYSDPLTFTKQYPVTTLISPLSGSQVGETPTFVWSPVDGAARYRLQVSRYSTFGIIYDEVETNNTRYTPTRAYETGVTYYWRVAIIDKHGKQGPFNTATIILDPYPYRVYIPLAMRRS